MLHNPLERWSYVSEHRLKNRFILIIKHPVPLPPTHWFRSLARRPWFAIVHPMKVYCELPEFIVLYQYLSLCTTERITIL